MLFIVSYFSKKKQISQKAASQPSVNQWFYCISLWIHLETFSRSRFLDKSKKIAFAWTVYEIFCMHYFSAMKMCSVCRGLVTLRSKPWFRVLKISKHQSLCLALCSDRDSSALLIPPPVSSKRFCFHAKYCRSANCLMIVEGVVCHLVWSSVITGKCTPALGSSSLCYCFSHTCTK